MRYKKNTNPFQNTHCIYLKEGRVSRNEKQVVLGRPAGLTVVRGSRSAKEKGVIGGGNRGTN